MAFSPTWNDEQFTTTLHRHLENERDQRDYKLPVLDCIEQAGTDNEEGGTRITTNFNLTEHSDTTELSTGYETINLNVRSVGKPGIDDWAYAIRPIVVSGKEKLINRGNKRKLVDIVQRRATSTRNGYRRQLHKRLCGIAGVGLLDVNSFNGIDYTDGFLENAAVGAQTNTIHTVSKGNYLAVPGMQNQYVDGGGSFSSNGLNALDTILHQAMAIADTDGKFVVSIAFAQNLKRALRTQERYVSEKEIDGGRMIMVYNGHPILMNRDMVTAGGDSAETISAMFIDFDAIKMLVNGDVWFKEGEFVSRFGSGQDTSAAPISLMCQLVAESVGSSGLIIDADAW